MQDKRQDRSRHLATPAVQGSPNFPPPTVSRAALLVQGSDVPFRELVDSMLAFGAELQKARETLARAIGMTPPQYSILMAVARHAGSDAVSVGEVAEILRVSLPFVVKQTGILVREGALLKKTDARDRRRVNLALTPRSIEAIRDLAPMQVRLNDALFASLSGGDAAALSNTMKGLLASARTLAL